MTESRIKTFQKNCLSPSGDMFFPIEDIESLASVPNNFIGKEQVILDKADPLSSAGKTSSDYLV